MQRPAASLPPLDPDSARHSARVAAHLRQAIADGGGWLPFEQWMAQALYAPGLGYYAAGNLKLASSGAANAQGLPIAAGDFVTAPELTPLFGHTVALQAAEVLAGTGTNTVLEFGAGTGALADSVLAALDAQGLPGQYRIMEVSADLRARQ